ncbi:MAG: double-strand break repair protein AddB [Caulobacterales bacterium]
MFTIPAGAPFLPSLAAGLHAALDDPNDPLALSRALVLVPTRRAAQVLAEAFAALSGGAALPPRIAPLGDLEIEDDPPPLHGANLAVAPAIDPLARQMELAELLTAKARAEGFPLHAAGALALARELANLLDQAALYDSKPWTDLSALVEDADLAEHWRRNARFLEIVAEAWPARLLAEGLIDPGRRRAFITDVIAKRWRDNPPPSPLIIAGSTGAQPATRRLIEAAANAPQGLVVLPGLDQDLDKDAWEELDAQHPQRALKGVLEHLKIEREQVRLWPTIEEAPAARRRRRLINEALRPAERTADWLDRLQTLAGAEQQEVADFVASGAAGMTRIDARNDEEEALTVALHVRGALAEGMAHILVVTPQASLARRIAAKLARWTIIPDTASGASLAEAPIGGFLNAILEAALAPDGALAWAVLLKNPLLTLDRDAGFARAAGAVFERKALRGRMPPSLESFAQALDDPKRPDSYPAEKAFIADLAERMAPLIDFLTASKVALPALAQVLIETAESLSLEKLEDGFKDGAARLWSGPDGEIAADLFTRLLALGEQSLQSPPRDSVDAIGALIRDQRVRNRDGDPRVRILGPLEARLLDADLVILAGLNEGSWPAATGTDALTGPRLRRVLGLPDLEERVALAAHDFAELACAPRLILSRAQRVDSAPAIASRWLWRLSTLAEGALGKERAHAIFADAHDYLHVARLLDTPAKITPVSAPAPKPPAATRPRKLSITDIETLIRDPYAIYAKHVLGLRALDTIGPMDDARALGTAIHAALDNYCNGKPRGKDAVLQSLDATLAEIGLPREQRERLAARLEETARDFAAWHAAQEAAGVRTLHEISGAYKLPSFDPAFILHGRADRIDIHPDGWAAILDYKTGASPTIREALSFVPQLSLEAAMLAAGAFKDQDGKVVRAQSKALTYARFRKPWLLENVATDSDVALVVEQKLNELTGLLLQYAKDEQPYLSKPRSKFARENGDYDLLARRAEWADSGEGE